jgi:phosphoglycerol transferase MdoB-like AlkP superfamily enzyme
MTMSGRCAQAEPKGGWRQSVRRLYELLVPRAYSAIVFAALFCTLAVKLFHSVRSEMVEDYLSWILADIAVLLWLEMVLSVACFRWPRKWVFRAAVIVAALACTWAVMNAGFLIKTGRQILPSVLLPVFRDALSALRIIGVSLVKMPVAAAVLLGPSALALAFVFFVLARPSLPHHNRRLFTGRITVTVVIILSSLLARATWARHGSTQALSEGLRYNCHLRAVAGLFIRRTGLLTRNDLANASRAMPTFDQVYLPQSKRYLEGPRNVVMVVLEGIQYRYTSLFDKGKDLTPHLASIAGQGAEFTSARSVFAHTTKALFGMLTGRCPSTSHDIVEAVPAEKPYASLPTILRQQAGYRTAFFQSAMGSFESRPGLVHNLGFDEFWARDDLADPNAFVGYLACDEFSLLEPVAEWIKDGDGPFFVTVLCSVTHDPYEVPEWFTSVSMKRFSSAAEEPVEHYRQAVYYTDKFLAALDAELAALNLVDNTILCVIGDHGEAFGEHGVLGHERIAFDEVYQVPLVIRAPKLVQPGVKIDKPLSSVDTTPTLLALLGFELAGAGFDGINALGDIPDDRRVYFCDWKHEGPVGYVAGSRKFIYYPSTDSVSVYDLSTDPLERTSIELAKQQTDQLAEQVIAWRKANVFRSPRKQPGSTIVFNRWLCRWSRRGCLARYLPRTSD